MRIYTKTGDDGTTGLVGGQRIAKTDLRIRAIGEVDELNASIGLAAATGPADAVANMLRTIQNRLFDIGAELASPTPTSREVRWIDDEDGRALENFIDSMTELLPPLRHFILPGGGERASRLHLARTICRRTERTVLELSQKASLRDVIPIYLNRLSDWLFVAARVANHAEGIDDVRWNSEEHCIADPHR